jgi:hypothetical protein
LRPAAERHGRILRLRQGATLLRSKGEGWFKTQPLIGAGDRLGNNAWVREIRRSGSKLFVEPVNADAHQAVALAPYVNPGTLSRMAPRRMTGREMTKR